MSFSSFRLTAKNCLVFCFTILCSVQLNAQNGTDATGVKKAIIDLAKKGDQKGVENEIRNLEIIITGHGAKRKIALELKDIANELNQNEHSEASILMSRKTISFATDHFGSNDTIVGIANDYIGNNYLQLGQADSALIYYDKATKVLKDNHVPAQYAFSLIGKTVSHYYLNEIMEMEKPLMEARDISYHKATDNEDLRGLCSQLSGVLYDAIGDYDKAIELNKEAISVNLSKPIPDSIILATDYNNLGAAYFTKGDFDLTNEYLEESLKISQKLNIVDEGTLRVLVNLIFSYSQKNDVQNTKKYLKLGEEMIMDYPFLKNQFSYISFLNAACYLHLDENDFKKCIQKANLMLSRLNKTDVDYLYLANLHLGRAYLLAEDFFLAEKYLNKSIEVYENNKDGIYEGKNLGYTYLAELSLKKKEFRKALNECQKGMAVLLNDSTLTDGLDNPGLVKNVRYSHLFELIKIKTETAKQLFLNEKNAAFIELTHQTFQFGIEVLGIMRNESVTTESKQFLLKETLPFYENAIANAIALYKFSGDPKYIDEAFKFNQEGKAILLLERINESKAKIFANIPDSILQKEKMLKQDISFYQKQLFDESLFGENADSLKINLWSEKVFKLKRSLENLNEMLNEQFPRYAELREQPDLPDIGKIQKDLLAENEIFIEYFTGQEQIFTFVITKDQYEVFSLGLEVPVKEQAEALVDQINKPPSASLKEATTNFSSSARDLYNFLIAPFSEKLFDTEKLLIVPHGWLNFIPFELLLTSDASGASFRHLPYLFRSHAINYAPAASIFFDMVKSDKALNNDLLAFAPFYSHPEEPSTIGNSQADLPGAQEEVSALRKYFSGDFYFGKDATETNFKNQANKYGLVHLAMHGSTNTDAPMYAKLDFSPVDDPTEDNQLYAYEIYQLDINSKLVVLSACESGFGQFVHGEGVISLAQSFLQVGAQSVTMSLWEAQDHATQFIMGEYYKGLRDGVAKDRALRTAKLKYLEEPAHQKHPFFWAPFVNIGDPSPIVTPVSYWIWGGLCLLFALVVFAYFRFKSK